MEILIIITAELLILLALGIRAGARLRAVETAAAEVRPVLEKSKELVDKAGALCQYDLVRKAGLCG